MRGWMHRWHYSETYYLPLSLVTYEDSFAYVGVGGGTPQRHKRLLISDITIVDERNYNNSLHRTAFSVCEQMVTAMGVHVSRSNTTSESSEERSCQPFVLHAPLSHWRRLTKKQLKLSSCCSPRLADLGALQIIHVSTQSVIIKGEVSVKFSPGSFTGWWESSFRRASSCPQQIIVTVTRLHTHIAYISAVIHHQPVMLAVFVESDDILASWYHKRIYLLITDV